MKMMRYSALPARTVRIPQCRNSRIRPRTIQSHTALCCTHENKRLFANRLASLLFPCRKMLSDVLLSNGQSTTSLENPWTNFIATNKHDREMLIHPSVTVLLLPLTTRFWTSSTRDQLLSRRRREKTVALPPLIKMHTEDLARLCDLSPRTLLFHAITKT